MRYRARVIEFPVGFPVDSLMSFPVDSLMSFPVDSLMNFPGSEGIVEDVKNGFSIQTSHLFYAERRGLGVLVRFRNLNGLRFFVIG